MKIAILANTAWNTLNFRLALAQKLQNSGHEILILGQPDGSETQLKNAGFSFFPVIKMNRKSQNPFSELQLFREISGILKREKPDLLLTFTIKANIWGNRAAEKLKIPTISTLTGLGFVFLNENWKTRFIQFFLKKTLESNQFVVFQNLDDAQLLIDKFGIFNKNITLIRGSGVDVEYFAPQSSSIQPDNKIRFLFIGRLLIDKGIREFCEAAKIASEQNPNIICQILGDFDPQNPAGIAENDFQILEKSSGVAHLGYASDVRNFIKNADVVVLPSYREGLPKSILESMSMAKPVLVSDVPGCRETVENGQNGLLFEVKNAQDLANKMLEMSQFSTEKRQKMGEIGRKMVISEFSSEKITAQYLELIEQVFKK
jgi:glycosyltransferase involved in cell wall biosynthesis